MVAFSELWRNHPRITGNTMPCGTEDEINYANQCTIRLGVCFENSGINTAQLPNVRKCTWYYNKIPGHKGHLLRAEELAIALKTYGRHFPWLGSTEEINPVDFKTTLVRKKGIIFFKDYYRRTRKGGGKESHRNRSGDHIDLWNGLQLTDPQSLPRIQLGLLGPGQSSKEKSKSIWFWEIH